MSGGDAAAAPVVLVAGAGDPVAAHLAERLGRRYGCRTTGAPADLAGTDVLVYAAASRGVGGVAAPDDAASVFAAAREAGIGRAVVVSSAAVHEPTHHHPGIAGEARLPPPRTGNRVAASYRAVEAAARRAFTGNALVVLRPATVALPGSGDFLVRELFGAPGERRRPGRIVAGHDPPLQLLAPGDLAEAVARAVDAVRQGRGGTFHLAPGDAVSVRRAVAATGRRRRALPLALRRRIARRRGREPDSVDYLRYPWTVSGEAARRELGFVPRRSTIDALAAFAAPSRQGAGLDREAAGEGDPFGGDPDSIRLYGRTLFPLLHDRYWRIELAGLHHVPREGGAVLVGLHRGFMPFDGVMALYAVLRETGRIVRFLIHPALAKPPWIGDFITKLGGIPASRENADWVLSRGRLLGIFPEGIRGAFCLYRDAYRLQRFGRDRFVEMALAHGVPIVPFVTVGSAEIFPIWGKLRWRWWRRVSEWPCLPVTTPVPLPSKWHTRFLPPVDVGAVLAEAGLAAGGGIGPEAAGDRRAVRAIGDAVRERMEATLTAMRDARPSIFHGSIFTPEERARREVTT